MKRLIPLIPFFFLLPEMGGCSQNKPDPTPAKTPSEAERAIEQAFTRLQANIAALQEKKQRVDDPIWDLLGPGSQADAEREAKIVKDAYAKLTDKDKADLEQKLALSAKELGDMNGKHYVKSQLFLDKYQKVPESKVSKITITGEKATLDFVQPDKNTVTVGLTRHKTVEGQPLLDKWKFKLEIPPAPK